MCRATFDEVYTLYALYPCDEVGAALDAAHFESIAHERAEKERAEREAEEAKKPNTLTLKELALVGIVHTHAWIEFA